MIAGAGAAIALMHFSRGPINEWNLARIKDGMTLEDVEQILGGPAARTEKVHYQPRTIDPLGKRGIYVTSSQSWVGDGLTIRVGFLSDGTVAQVQSYGNRVTLAERLRRWFRLDPPMTDCVMVDPLSTHEIIPD